MGSDLSLFFFFSFDLHFSSLDEEDRDEGADMDVTNSSAPGMSETEDDDNQLSKKDVCPPLHQLSVTTRNLKCTVFFHQHITKLGSCKLGHQQSLN